MLVRALAPLAVLLALVLLATGCGGFEPSDEPLPTVAELRAEFDAQPLGKGIVREGSGSGGERYHTTAVHETTGEGELARLFVDLVSETPAVAITIFVSGSLAENLEPGDELQARFIYGRGDAARGGGVLGVTAVEDGRIAGVFAADLAPGGLVPDFRRIRGAFNATPDTTVR